MMFWPLLFLALARAEDLALERYCFSSPQKMQTVSQRLKVILVPSDQVEKEPYCLSIAMKPHRRELIQAYIRQIEPHTSIAFSSAEIKREPCKLKVEKIGVSNKKNRNLKISSLPRVSETQHQEDQQETYQIQTLNDFELVVNQDKIKGKCRFITPDKYEITIKIQKEPRPLIPPVPAGTVVVIEPGQSSEPQETGLLETQLQLARGSRLELGSIIKDLRKNSQQVELAPQAQFSATTGRSQQKTFLSLF
jgi:hypothetical protein